MVKKDKLAQERKTITPDFERFETTFDAIPDLVSIHDGDFRIVKVNKAFADALGMEAGELIGKKCHEIIHGTKRSWPECPHREVLKSGKAITKEFWEPRLKKYLQVSASPIRNEKGKMIGSVHIARDITDRKQAEAKIKESKTRSEQLAEQSRSIPWEIDEEGLFTYVGHASEKVVGYRPEDLVGKKHFYDLCPEDKREMVKAGAFALFERRNQFVGLEHVVLAKDGPAVWVSINGMPKINADGRQQGYLGSITDITEHKRAEALLRQSEESAQRIAGETTAIAKIGEIISSTLDIEEVYERFAEEARKLISFDRISINLHDPERGNAFVAFATGLEIEGRRKGDAFPLAGSANEELIRTWRPLLIQGKSVPELQNRFPALISSLRAGLISLLSIPLIARGKMIGGLFFCSKEADAYAEGDVRVAESVANQIAGAIANALLFQKQKRVEEELLKSEERYRRMVENAPLGLLTMDSQGNIMDVNPQTVSIFGSPSAEACREINLLTFPLLVKAGIAAKYRRCLETGKPDVYATSYRSKWGKEIYLRYHLTPIRNSEGKITGVQSLLEDISEQKKLQEQLQQSQKMEAIGTLAGGIAHDFNNILAAILGYAELAGLDVLEGSKARYNLDQSIKSAHRARDLVQQILAFSRQGKQERKPLDIRPIVKEGLKLLRSSLPATIEIRQEIEEDLGAMEADLTQVYQVLMNLCTNAAQAMGDHGGLLEVSLNNVALQGGISAPTAGLEPGPYLRLRVRDTGIGIPPEVLKRIFDPYFTTKEVGKGTGLGLAVVHGIVRSYGGAIAVSSEAGKGSTFDVYFPRITGGNPHLEPEKSEPLPLAGHERVLFVDDEQEIVEVGRNILEHLGYEAVARTSSLEALELFKALPDRFDLVITDMTMPNMTGDRLAQEILRIRPGTPIILCTGFSENISEEKASALGIREFAMKPLVMKDLAKAIRRALDSPGEKGSNNGNRDR